MPKLAAKTPTSPFRIRRTGLRKPRDTSESKLKKQSNPNPSMENKRTDFAPKLAHYSCFARHTTSLGLLLW
jgi:hypothetical protein